MSVIGSNILAGASGQAGYNLTKSLRFRSSASAYLNRTPASAGNRKTMTFSFWVKRGLMSSTQQNMISAGTGGDNYIAWSSTNDYIEMNFRNGGSASNVFLITTQVFRDPSAWYHIVLAIDTTQATASNRVKLYVNGSQVTAFGTTTYPTQNNDLNGFNNNVIHHIGQSGVGGFNFYLDGYLAEVNFIDGQALTPSSFGETSTSTGVWIPKKYTGTYGTNGFYLPFTDTTSTSTLGTDFSGNSNTWTVNNISLTAGSTYDSMTDVPTNTNSNTANYCTLNPTVPKTYCTQTDGNLKSAGTSSTDSDTSVATMGVSSGKWYWEDKIGTISSAVYPIFGAGRNILSSFIGKYPGDSSVGGLGIVVGNGNIVREGSTVTTVTALVANDVVGFALDLGALTCAIYKNNSLIYTVTGLTAGTYYPMANEYSSSNSTHNYGQQPFAYTPPSGFYPLNTYNLPTPTILDGDQYFNATLYTGNNSTQSVTGVGFQPDFVWIKERDAVEDHFLFDALRGATNFIRSNTTDAEATLANYLTAFNSDGFSLGNGGGVNGASDLYVSWNWRASNAAGVSNTQGTITSTVSANTTAGFSIVTYTGNGTAGATIGHGLGVAPSMIIVKRRDNGSGGTNWFVYNKYLNNGTNPAQFYLILQSTSGQGGASNIWNDTAPTSTVFSVGTSVETNGSTGTFVAYCFTPIAGYSAFGSYTGNGSSDGTFIFTGFRPRYVMIKASSTGGAGYDWFIHDTARDTYNACTKDLEANLSLSEDQYGAEQDFLSNGFKLRNTGGGTNQNGVTYIYMAFAESPFKYANAR